MVINQTNNLDSLPPELRLFISISLPPQVKESIQQMQREMRRSLASNAIRWTRAEQFHLTLKFMGNVATEKVPDLTAALGAACSTFAPLQLHARCLGFFPNARAPRVLWVGIHETHSQLVQLQAAMEARASPFTVEPPEKQFRAHVTLARLKGPQRSDVETLCRLVETNAEKDFGHWTTAEVELMRSSLSPTGASHFTIATIPLVPKL